MKKTLLVSSLLIGTLLVSGTAFARMGGHGGGYCDKPRMGHGSDMSEEMHEMHMEHRLEFLEIALDLTDDQREKLETMGEQHFEKHQAQREKIRALGQEMRELAHAADFDADAFRAKAIEQAEVKTDMHAKHANMKDQFMAVLNAEQKAKAEKLWALGMGGGHGMGCGQGMHGKGMGMHGKGMHGMHGKGMGMHGMHGKGMHGGCENCPHYREHSDD